MIRVYGFKEFQLRTGEHVWLDSGYCFLAHVWKHVKSLLHIPIKLDKPYAEDKVYRYYGGM